MGEEVEVVEVEVEVKVGYRSYSMLFLPLLLLLLPLLLLLLPLPGRILQSLMPLLMPKDGHTYKLLRDHDSLLDQCTAVLTHVLQYVLRCLFATGALALGGHREGVDEGLGRR